MTTFCDNLPERTSSKNGSIFYQPSESSPTPAGVLSIRTDRAWVQYAVAEFRCDFPGRAFRLAKLTPGTDAESESYSCFVATDGRDRVCECKGFFYTSRDGDGHCKHLDSVSALLENRWI